MCVCIWLSLSSSTYRTDYLCQRWSCVSVWQSDTQLTVKSALFFCIGIKHCNVYYANVPGKYISYCDGVRRSVLQLVLLEYTKRGDVCRAEELYTWHFMQFNTSKPNTMASELPYSWNSLTESHQKLNITAFIKVAFILRNCISSGASITSSTPNTHGYKSQWASITLHNNNRTGMQCVYSIFPWMGSQK